MFVFPLEFLWVLAVSQDARVVLFLRGHPVMQFSGEGGLFPLNANPQCPERRASFKQILLLLFFLSLPLINPIVHGDGVGYYAYARAPLIEHSFHFEEDWRHANLNFSQSRTSPGWPTFAGTVHGDRVR